LYRLFAYGLDLETTELADAVITFRKARSECSFTHLLTLLGIAVKEVAAEAFESLIEPATPAAERLSVLEATLRDNGEEIAGILAVRQNSFTAARRFLVVQVLLGAYFRIPPAYPVNFADLGTGLGILPRQLNSRVLFERFSRDLRWNGRKPAFRAVPLAARFGVERGPRPDLRWVRACYGATHYYRELFRELEMSRRVREVEEADVAYEEFDILEYGELARFIDRRQINVVNLSYVLYEIDADRRNRIIDVLNESLFPPKLIIVTEPGAELTRPGCTVSLHDDSRTGSQRLCIVSDGHFRGDVQPLQDYASFVSRYPIPFAP
jgi:hypothetical protein